VKRLVYLAPALAFAAIAFFFFHSLTQSPDQALPSPLVGKHVPRMDLPPLDAQTKGFGPRELSSGHVTVVNVFASWCAPCRSEAPVLERLARDGRFSLYGVAQKDTPARVRAFLKEVGDPFRRIALDADGRAGIEWGVYGVPETFVVDGRGVIRARIVGEITPEVLDGELMPAIREAQSAS
jgi:cytochrome c biogenesis protein CcmG/thiol:disulfide interchange protein DsbE